MPTVADPFGTVGDGGVFLPDAEALVVADLHLGKAAASGVDVPLDEGATVVARMGDLLDRFAPAIVVLAGDVLDAVGAVPVEARTALAALRERVETTGATLVTVEGNHDGQLGALDDGPIVDEHVLADGTVVCHGHERPTATGRRYVVGHDHPAIVINGRRRPCFLYGPAAYRGGDVLALPSFNPGVRGSSVNAWSTGDPLSPLLCDVDQFRPVVWDVDAGDALVFPALRSLQRYL